MSIPIGRIDVSVFVDILGEKSKYVGERRRLLSTPMMTSPNDMGGGKILFCAVISRPHVGHGGAIGIL